MTFDFYVSVSSLAVILKQFLIGSWKRVLPWCFFCFFLYVVLFYNTCCLMSQMNPTKKNLTNLDLNPGQLVQSVPDWVGCRVA